MTAALAALNAITNRVLAYRPRCKSKKSKKRMSVKKRG